MRVPGPVRIGWESVKANAAPMVVLQVAATVLAGVYCLCPAFQDAIDPIARIHRRYGWLSAFVSQAFFCGILPGVFQLAMVSIRPAKPWATILAQTIWCGVFGIGVDELFKMFAACFGNDASFFTLAQKTAVDQFVWTALVVAPANSVFYFWVGRDFSLGRVKREWPKRFIRKVYLPNLVANWCVWTPVCMAVFAFPLPLQLYMNGLACTFWTLMCVQLGKRSG